jgi:hypothetical protein
MRNSLLSGDDEGDDEGDDLEGDEGDEGGEGKDSKDNKDGVRDGIEARGFCSANTDRMYANQRSIQKIKQLLVNRGNSGDSKRVCMLVYGPPGTSKSFTVNKLLHDNNCYPVVLDAIAVKQNESALTDFVVNAITTSDSLTSKQPVFVVDNVQGHYTKNQERSTSLIIKVLQKCLKKYNTGTVPVIVIADGIVSKEMKALAALIGRDRSLSFPLFKEYEIRKIACEFASDMKLALPRGVLERTVVEAKGDVRKLCNLLKLQQLSPSGVVDGADATSNNLFTTTGVLFSNRGSLQDRENLVAGDEDMHKAMQFENYHQLHQLKHPKDYEAMEDLAEQADIMGDMDIIRNHWARNSAPSEDARAMSNFPLVSKAFAKDRPTGRLGFPKELTTARARSAKKTAINNRAAALGHSALDVVSHSGLFEGKNSGANTNTMQASTATSTAASTASKGSGWSTAQLRPSASSSSSTSSSTTPTPSTSSSASSSAASTAQLRPSTAAASTAASTAPQARTQTIKRKQPSTSSSSSTQLQPSTSSSSSTAAASNVRQIKRSKARGTRI